MCEIKAKNEVYDVALVSLLLILDILKLLVFLFFDFEHVFVWWIAIKLPKESGRSEANF